MGGNAIQFAFTCEREIVRARVRVSPNPHPNPNLNPNPNPNPNPNQTSASGPEGASDAPPLDVDGRQYSELLPAAAPRAKRGAEHVPSGRGLGGGTLGSEVSPKPNPNPNPNP